MLIWVHSRTQKEDKIWPKKNGQKVKKIEKFVNFSEIFEFFNFFGDIFLTNREWNWRAEELHTTLISTSRNCIYEEHWVGRRRS